MEANQAHATAVIVDDRQDADLRWAIFHQTQSVKCEHLGIGDDRIVRHQIVTHEIRETKIARAQLLQRPPQITSTLR